MKRINYERSWCEYLTPCPYKNKNKEMSGIFVGDFDCHECKYCIGINDKERYVLCDFEKS